MSAGRAALPGLAMLALAACDPGPPAPPAGGAAAPAPVPWAPTLHFTDVTAGSGLELVTTSGRSPSTQILEVKGGGVGLVDFDGDGDLDVFVANGATLDAPDAGPGCRLFENVGDMRFVDATAAAGLTLRRWAMGVAVADYDADGHDDVYVSCFGPDALLRNTGDGRLEDVGASAGIDAPGWGTGCSFGDLDGDGDLDLHVAHFVEFDPAAPPPPTTFMGETVLAGPMGLPAHPDVLYENVGGTFRDVSGSWIDPDLPPSYGLGTVVLDFTGDDRADVYVGNDSRPNYLLVRGADGVFRDAGLRLGLSSNLDGANQATMGIAIADVDGDGRPDVYTTNFSSDTNTLHVSTEQGAFTDRTAQFGLGMNSRPYLGWACGFFDFDHDGDEDLLVVNGHVYPQADDAPAIGSPYEQPILLYERRERFVPVRDGSAGDAVDAPYPGRGAAFGDLDGDGDVDVVTTGVNAPVRLLRNDCDGGDWLVVSLADRRPGSANRAGIGARVTLIAGDVARHRWIHSGGSFESASALVAHFALDPSRAGNPPLAVEVRWPDGTVQRAEHVPMRTRVVIERTE